MKRNSSGAIWGLILIVCGLSIASNSLGIFSFKVFFKGWWTLFIIIPCFIRLCNGESKKRTSNIIGLCIGVFLLLSQFGIVPWHLFGPLLFAGIFVLLGAKMIFSDQGKKDKNAEDKRTRYYQEDIWVDNNEQQADYTGEYYNQSSFFEDTNKEQEQINEESKQNDSYNQQTGYQYNSYNNNSNNNNYSQTTQDYRDYRSSSYKGSGERVACSAIFTGKDLRYDYEPFTGGIFSVVFGGIDLDLRHAIIRNDVTIEAKVIFGGMDIILPDNVRVVLDNTSILGGVENRKKNPPIVNEYIPTIFINATSVFGGIDIK